MKKKHSLLLISVLSMALLPQWVIGMHIMEGFLSPTWSLLWGVISLPFVFMGYRSIQKTIKEHPKAKLLLAMAGAFIFVLSALKLPSITGSSSHPTGVGLGAIIFGPLTMSVLGLIALLFQAILLAHGGITTLGANTFSMGIAGPFIAYGSYRLVKKLKGPQWLAVFIGAFLGNLLTYVVTSLQLALAFPSDMGGVMNSFMRFMGVFAVTQVPLAISEGIITVLIFNAIATYRENELVDLNVLSKEVI